MLKDYKIIDGGLFNVVGGIGFSLMVSNYMLEICESVKDEKIILHHNSQYFLINEVSFGKKYVTYSSDFIVSFDYTVKTDEIHKEFDDVSEAMMRLSKIKKIMNS